MSADVVTNMSSLTTPESVASPSPDAAKLRLSASVLSDFGISGAEAEALKSMIDPAYGGKNLLSSTATASTAHPLTWIWK